MIYKIELRTYVSTKACKQMFTEVVLIIPKFYKQQRCLSRSKGIACDMCMQLKIIDKRIWAITFLKYAEVFTNTSLGYRYLGEAFQGPEPCVCYSQELSYCSYTLKESSWNFAVAAVGLTSFITQPFLCTVPCCLELPIALGPSI